MAGQMSIDGHGEDKKLYTSKCVEFELYGYYPVVRVRHPPWRPACAPVMLLAQVFGLPCVDPCAPVTVCASSPCVLTDER